MSKYTYSDLYVRNIISLKREMSYLVGDLGTFGSFRGLREEQECRSQDEQYRDNDTL